MKPHLKQQWCLTKLTSSFLAQMEEILHLYSLPYNPQRPLLCFDEMPYQLIADRIAPQAMAPGRPAREDYTYTRLGVWNLLGAFQPACGQRCVQIRQRRTARDYTAFMQTLATRFAQAEKIVVVQDNLNTHTTASFYKVLPPAQAFALAQRFEFHYTPPHASWLNLIEIEFSVIARGCLDTRFPAFDAFASALLDFIRARNRDRASVSWQFTPDLARDTLKRHYDSVRI